MSLGITCQDRKTVHSVVSRKPGPPAAHGAAMSPVCISRNGVRISNPFTPTLEDPA